MKSYKTTVCACVGIAAGAVVVADFGPLVTKIAGCLASAANSIGLVFAADERKLNAILNGAVKSGRNAVLALLAVLSVGTAAADPLRIEWLAIYKEELCGGCRIVTIGFTGHEPFERYWIQKRDGPGQWQDFAGPVDGQPVPGSIVGIGFRDDSTNAIYRVRKETP